MQLIHFSNFLFVDFMCCFAQSFTFVCVFSRETFFCMCGWCFLAVKIIILNESFIMIGNILF